MAMKLVCDVCGKPVEPKDCVRSNGDFNVTAEGVYLSGHFTVQMDGKGKTADVCFDCVRKVLLMKDVNVSDGAKDAAEVVR